MIDLIKILCLIIVWFSFQLQSEDFFKQKFDTLKQANKYTTAIFFGIFGLLSYIATAVLFFTFIFS
jgi:hypothetical protein